jgi:hypothetical protein
MAVFTAAYSNSTVVLARAVAAAVFISKGFKFFPSCVPVNVFSFFVMIAGGTNAVFVKNNTRSCVRHSRFFAVSHKSLSFKGLTEILSVV